MCITAPQQEPFKWIWAIVDTEDEEDEEEEEEEQEHILGVCLH